MLKQRLFKIMIALGCIMTIIMPYALPSFAIQVKQTDETANFKIIDMWPGGSPSGGLPSEEMAVYDRVGWNYLIPIETSGVTSNTTIYKIVEATGREFEGTTITDYSNELFCLDAKKTFPGMRSDDPYQTYKNDGSIFDTSNEKVKELHMGTDKGSNSEEWTSNYQALTWLLKNIYLPRQDSAVNRNVFLNKVFKNYSNDDYPELSDISTVRAHLTDDDIEVTEQLAIWYFTNADDTTNYHYSDTSLKPITRENDLAEKLDTHDENIRKAAMDHLYSYLIAQAKTLGGNTDTSVVPAFSDTKPTCTTSSDHYVIGTYKYSAGTYAQDDYSINLVDQDGNDIEDYKILIKGGTEFSSKTLKELADQEFYIYIPKEGNEGLKSVKLTLKYEIIDTKATLWNDTKNTDDIVYQPITLVTRESAEKNPSISVDIVDIKPDLALRKYIISAGDNKYDRKPQVDLTDLKNGDSTTATYKHKKSPVTVKAGDKVVFEIRVYNEGEKKATNVVIADALPEGYEYIEDDPINTTYKWDKKKDGTNRVVYTCNLPNEIDAFDKENDTSLPSAYVQIALKVKDDVTSTTVLTNVAEIYEDRNDGKESDDVDSDPNSNEYVNEDKNSSSYSGDVQNKADLDDSNYYYKGYQDDDDFEKTIVDNPEKPNFDLNMKKYISKVISDEKEIDYSSREPKVDVTPLKNGAKDASYTSSKTPVTVKVGDIVTYSFKVYNEGQVDGYAKTISDYIPEGLGYIVDIDANTSNKWKLPEGNTLSSVKLSSIDNAMKNYRATLGKNLSDDPTVVKGKVKITTDKIAYGADNQIAILKGFDKSSGTSLSQSSVCTVTCVVLSTDNTGNKLRNIAEIVEDKDKDGNDVEDVDSTPDSTNPDNYPDGEKRPDGTQQDDNDYENLTPDNPKIFDLALKKYISQVNDTAINDRVPKVTKGTNGKPVISMPNKNPVQLANNDLVTYTIRVYNEGEISGYAKEITDDIPKGLIYVPENDTNKKYGWKLYDKNGNVTSDITQAVSIKTDYLSKKASEARNENCLIKAYDESKGVISYQEVKVVFKIDETPFKDDKSRNIINIAEISNDEDENGNPVDDVDSTPGDNKGPDDLDQESVYVKYFDLALKKYLAAIVISENGNTRQINVAETDGLQKVEIHKNRINSTVVKFIYKIRVTNEGQIAGFADEIIDYIPEGLQFVAEDNPTWTKISDKAATTTQLNTTLLEPGKSAEIEITLRWINGDNNFGLKTNIAEISKDRNNNGAKDRDSTPGNYVAAEDDQDDAPVMLQISTGTIKTYTLLVISVISILLVGCVMIKKYVL